MYNLILWWATVFLRLFFRRIIVYGRDYIPSKGPLIVASNHPSAFMEASVLAIVIGRQLHFLVRGDVFHPRFRWLFNWTNQIPIYRQKDGITNLRKNASSFDLTYSKLGEGCAVLIFPEAKTVLEKKLRPIQRGTAHLAFGTLPMIKPGEVLRVIPVGVNFMDPRIAGTDVVVRFGMPFIVQEGTREDRDSIEAFTNSLQSALQPLIIQVDNVADEKKYEILASVYSSLVQKKRSVDLIHDDLSKVASAINQTDKDPILMQEINNHIKDLSDENLEPAIYFPGVLIRSRIELVILLALKMTWWLAGGWIWRLVYHLVRTKIKADTYQGPTSVGAAMVLYPLISILFLLIALAVDWPLWIVPAWWAIMALGKLIPAPVSLLWQILKLDSGIRTTLKKRIQFFKDKIIIYQEARP